MAARCIERPVAARTALRHVAPLATPTLRERQRGERWGNTQQGSGDDAIKMLQQIDAPVET